MQSEFPRQARFDHAERNLHCGVLHWSFEGDPGSVTACNCTLCRRYGMPDRINTDNGPPWGSAGRGVTYLNIWMIRLGIRTSHSRPYHPQTNGKD